MATGLTSLAFSDTGASRPASLTAGTSAAPCATPKGRPWCDASLPPGTRAKLVVKALTGDEKLALLAGDDLVGPLRATDDARFRAGTVHGVARLGIPDLYLVDAGSMGVKQGPNTALAAGLSLAATFDTAAAGRAAGVVADEAAHRGNDVVLGPAVDIVRTPKGGRTFESYGEDPLLASRMGVAWIRTVQKAGLMAEVKHFPANNQEENRYAVNAVIDQRTLREIYLAPFEAAVRQGKVASVMCGYNLVNGRPSCSGKTLLDGVLRKQWGFDGMVVSDWGLAAKDTEGSIKAGLDLEMPVGVRYTPPALASALTSGKITWADIDARLQARLRVMFAYGMFDKPKRANDGEAGYTRNAATAQDLAEQGITLLKNTGGVLPLNTGTKVAVIGRAADQFRSGIGSMYVKPTSTTTPLQGIIARAGAGNVTYNDGSDPQAAADTARAAQVAVVVAADARAEDADVTCLTLKCGTAKDQTLGDQDALIDAVAAANPNTVVVLQTGGPVLTPWAAKTKGIVETWYAGQRGGAAIARVLYGDTDPGGRLPVSFPATEGDAPASGDPAHYPGTGGKVTYAEGVNIGYRHYDTRKITPAFPFGHGLSYTTFKLTGLKATRTAVTVTVTNTGKRRGLAVPQLYLGLRAAPGAAQPPKQLKGFTKAGLAPGQSVKVTFPLDARAFAYWDQRTRAWKRAPGCAKAMVGTSSRTIDLTGTIC
ncbi:glycoside hydrolase family 3 C-terminal domain-containing protein [Actinomadura formosensis]|uniref:glycoside hydrolase family 3 C-terminal domain-containing protein n=1 Tax=Actinomadura formosensis TaxID=60706 RepID=UPI00083582B1|nr:glycoside hydrolase family 3 C-terminal domain-containing protein [Actinomadura formosensis]